MKFLSLLAAVFLAAAALPAASVPRLNFEQIVRSSPRAVRGVVARSWSAWDDSRTAIWTHYEIRVAETLRGQTEATLTISEPGGVVDGLAMRVPGAPTLAVGEEAVIFAYPTPAGYWRVRGWGQGRFRVEERNGRRIVRAPLLGARLFDGKTDSGKAAGAPTVDGSSLDLFLEQVRGLIRGEDAR